ncbi:hypothetical protein E2P86_08185 [Sphingobacterium psychroaquaticum]|uniref:SGNH/GDSL hydrolase family protein n=1 Tax=Sphingobacterium psychroaquaticum TaxID=561061 RepID=UPI00106A3A8C|nr:SGNH/GDSL hydrolase family protein [Sphingobacterium psychroaquaticum]QBQ41135.1 hypothetical protein E2P86_08185 [Sphingobacterium psychroaquaticum]
MPNKNLNLTFFCLLVCLSVFSQKKNELVWRTPEFVQGQTTTEATAKYGRLPDNLQAEVRPPVWYLGTNSAGLHVDFTTDADSIVVRYKVKGALNMPHMPSTGVSGVDLYMLDRKKGGWLWSAGNYSFKDTISYTFRSIGSDLDRLYQLYLPLYNTVEWMEIGVPEGRVFKEVQSNKKPIIIYGTSIAQGACASRPGLGWTNILARNLQSPVVNLAFSGNGRLEDPILELIAKADPSIIVLDCLPNLGVIPERSEAQLDSLVYHAFSYLRKHHPHTPIVLTEHSSGFNSSILNHELNARFEQTSRVGQQVFRRLKRDGFKNIYLLSNREIGLDINSTVDYVHPNDIGMMKIADAYTKLLRKLL